MVLVDLKFCTRNFRLVAKLALPRIRYRSYNAPKELLYQQNIRLYNGLPTIDAIETPVDIWFVPLHLCCWDYLQVIPLESLWTGAPPSFLLFAFASRKPLNAISAIALSVLEEQDEVGLGLGRVWVLKEASRRGDSFYYVVYDEPSREARRSTAQGYIDVQSGTLDSSVNQYSLPCHNDGATS